MKSTVWPVKRVSARGTARDPESPFYKLFKAGRVARMWMVDSNGRSTDKGIVESTKKICPKNGDIIVRDGREYFVKCVSSSAGMQNVYVSALVDKTLAKDMTMTLKEFEAFLLKMRMEKGWVVTIDFPSVWCVAVSHKETKKLLGVTGSTSLAALVHFMKTVPIEQWEGEKP